MKSIVCVNVEVPTIENELAYESGGSLRDHDIILFDPSLPRFPRVEFSAGGSCISIEGAERISKHSNHWSRELGDAISSGKTVFLILNDYEDDIAAVGSTMSGKTRNYQTQPINNYSMLPLSLKVRNARGKKILVKDQKYKPLYDVISEISEYRVVLEKSGSILPVFAAKDGTPVGGVMRFENLPGSVVLLPYFDFEADGFVGEDDGGDVWTDKAIRTSRAFVAQLVSIDKMLRSATEHSPPPAWVKDIPKTKIFVEIENSIAEICSKIAELQQARDQKEIRRSELESYSHLLYETGKPLEKAIEKVLILIGYDVGTMRSGDLEIDHVLVSPDGVRMIGESEGKDASAIDISKFRQLESNIGEDFEREDITVPAKGLLFGNGFRLSRPEDRAEQFTQKSLTNAKRLGSALIRTVDLYNVAVWILDNPEDDDFKAACRRAIEDTVGGIVEFPKAES